MKLFTKSFEQTEGRNYYVNIPSYIRNDSSLTSNEKLLFGELAALSNKVGYCYASNNYLAKIFNVHKNTISKWVSKLCEFNYISIKLLENYKRRIYINEIVMPDKSYNEGGIHLMDNTPKPDDENNIISKNKVNSTDNELFYIFEEWNLFASENNLSKIIGLSNNRIKNIRFRIQESAFDLKKIFEEIKNSDFLLGKVEKWKVDFDFIFKNSTNYLKIIEGKYRNDNRKRAGQNNMEVNFGRRIY